MSRIVELNEPLDYGNYVPIVESYLSGTDLTIVHEDKTYVLTDGASKDRSSTMELFKIFLHIHKSDNSIPYEEVMNFIVFEGIDNHILVPDNIYYVNVTFNDSHAVIYGAWENNVIDQVESIKLRYEDLFAEKLEVNLTTLVQLSEYGKLLLNYISGIKKTTYEYFDKQVYIRPQAPRHNNPNATNLDEIELQAGHLKLMSLLNKSQKEYQEYLLKYCEDPSYYLIKLLEKYRLDIKLIDPIFKYYLMNEYGNDGDIINQDDTYWLNQLIQLGNEIGCNRFFDNYDVVKLPQLAQFHTELTEKQIEKLPDSVEKIFHLLKNSTVDLPLLNRLIKKYKGVLNSRILFELMHCKFEYLDEDNFKSFFLGCRLNTLENTPLNKYYTDKVTPSHLDTIKQYIKRYYEIRKNKLPRFYVDYLRYLYKDIIDESIKVYDRKPPVKRDNKVMTYILATCSYELCNIRICALKIPTTGGDKYIVVHLFHEKEPQIINKLFIPPGVYYDLDLEMYLPESYQEVDINTMKQEKLREVKSDLSRMQNLLASGNLDIDEEIIEEQKYRIQNLEGPLEDLDQISGVGLLYEIYGI